MSARLSASLPGTKISFAWISGGASTILSCENASKNRPNTSKNRQKPSKNRQKPSKKRRKPSKNRENPIQNCQKAIQKSLGEPPNEASEPFPSVSGACGSSFVEGGQRAAREAELGTLGPTATLSLRQLQGVLERCSKSFSMPSSNWHGKVKGKVMRAMRKAWEKA